VRAMPSRYGVKHGLPGYSERGTKSNCNSTTKPSTKDSGDEKRLTAMLETTVKLRGIGVSPLCALRLAIWKVERRKPDRRVHVSDSERSAELEQPATS
jgi:hypothetical protein